MILKTHEELNKLLDELRSSNQVHENSFILFCNDGSTDNTWQKLLDIKSKDSNIRAISFSKNFGHQYALLAGMEYCSQHSDINVCIDADLQHDIWTIPKFLEEYFKGADLVFGIKKKRGQETLLKNITAKGYYILMKLMGVNLIYNHADFRLLSRKATDAILQFKESNLFLRGLIPQIGMQQARVYYDVKDRFAGTTKYSLKRMLKFAADGITSSSIFPLRLISFLGLGITILCVIKIFDILYSYFVGESIPGWASTVLPVYFFGGLQLLALGTIGEYIGKTYLEVKRRPKFIISSVLE